jgi:hypothetical protein
MISRGFSLNCNIHIQVKCLAQRFLAVNRYLAADLEPISLNKARLRLGDGDPPSLHPGRVGRQMGTCRSEVLALTDYNPLALSLH